MEPSSPIVSEPITPRWGLLALGLLLTFFFLLSCSYARRGRPSLHEAAALGRVDAVRGLLRKGADPNAKDANGSCALGIAASHKRLEVVKLLIESGADIECRDRNGWSPLIGTALQGRLPVAEFLIKEGADVNAWSHNGTTPLMNAVMCQTVAEAFKESNEPAPLVSPDMDHKCEETLTLLLRNEAKVNMQNSLGNTAMHLAKMQQDEASLKMLLSHGGDPTIISKHGYSVENWEETHLCKSFYYASSEKSVPTEKTFKQAASSDQCIKVCRADEESAQKAKTRYWCQHGRSVVYEKDYSHPAVSSAKTYLKIVSESKDEFIGQGKAYSYDALDSTFRIHKRDYWEMNGKRYPNKAVVLYVSNPDGKGWWSLHFSGLNRGFIKRGEYNNARKYSKDLGKEPGLSIVGQGRNCRTISGRFTVHEIEYSKDFRRVDKLAVDFEQTCTDRSPSGILKGVVRYNSDL